MMKIHACLCVCVCVYICADSDVTESLVPLVIFLSATVNECCQRMAHLGHAPLLYESKACAYALSLATLSLTPNPHPPGMLSLKGLT